MAERLQIYKCNMCGHIIEVLHAGGGTLVCCGQPMTQLKEQTADAATEKHVPVIEKTDAGIKVTVGSVAHPMQKEHFIEWIELLTDGRVYRQFLTPGAEPQAVFDVTADAVSAREHCNVHGLWKG